ncbi:MULTISPECIES: hypothetical protein [unclassified Microbacterium]|uniref:hypothetical protein n=1 Tax=unclassified Microbacterium TaxID=2609290 RepID=UPI0010F688A4|nr:MULTISPECIES: hypothetical protein [unclassified Microbacterium]
MTTPKLHQAAMNLPLASPLPYPLFQRLRDAWIVGRRDGQKKAAHDVTGSEQPSASLRGLDAELTARCEWERLEAIRIASPLIDEHREHLTVITMLNRQIIEANAEIDARSVTDPSEYDRVPKSEAHLTPAQRKERRDREARNAIAPLIARRDASDAQVKTRELQAAEIAGMLVTLFEALQTRVTTLANHYERRAANQIRSYLRRAPGDAEHPLNRRAAFSPPEWACEPNPWLPAEGGQR